MAVVVLPASDALFSNPNSGCFSSSLEGPHTKPPPSAHLFCFEALEPLIFAAHILRGEQMHALTTRVVPGRACCKRLVPAVQQAPTALRPVRVRYLEEQAIDRAIQLDHNKVRTYGQQRAVRASGHRPRLLASSCLGMQTASSCRLPRHAPQTYPA